jgi:hypothetical protein
MKLNTDRRRFLKLTSATATGPQNKGYWLDNLNVTSVPEPSSAALLGLGGLALMLRRRK